MLEYVIPVSAAIAALVMVYLILNLLKQETGNKRMQEIAGAIREGAFAFLGRQYKTTGMHAIVVAIVLFFISHQNGIATAVTGNLRVAAGAKHSLNRALQIAFRSGAVTGLAVTTLSLIGVWVLFHAFGGASGALKEMVLPGVLVVAAPVIVGLWLKWEAVGLHHHRRRHGALPEHRRRRLGQCQEVH